MRIANLSLRAATLLARFLLVFVLAKLLTPEDLGLYGLVSATVMYSLFLVGLDFYTYVTREVAGQPPHEIGKKIKSQAALACLMYLLILPVLSLVFILGLLPLNVAPVFFVLVVLEHLGQELGRLLVALNHQMSATVVMFIRQGLWPVALVGLLLLDDSLAKIDTVFTLWACGGVVAVIIGVRALLRAEVRGWNGPIDWSWIATGVKVAIPLLLATLCLRGVITVDRYVVDGLVGPEILGAYVLFYGLANTLIAFLDAGVFVFYYPGLIAAKKSSEAERFKLLFWKMLLQTVFMAAVFALGSYLFLPHVLSWIGKSLFIENQLIYWILLMAAVLNGLGMTAHYVLYAHAKDRPIIISHVLALPVFGVSLWLALRGQELLAVPVALVCTYAFIMVFKWLACIVCVPGRFTGVNFHFSR